MAWRNRRFPVPGLVGLFWAVIASLAHGQIDGDPGDYGGKDLFSALALVDKTELAEMRGGFSLRGMQFEFGVNARTFIDGNLALETIITLTEGSGPVVQQAIPSSSATNGSLTLVNGAGPGAAGAFPSNLELSALADANGVVLNDSKGVTTILHQVNRDRILGVLVNMADGRDIRQETNVTVTVGGFKEFQQIVGSALLNSRIADAINR